MLLFHSICFFVSVALQPAIFRPHTYSQLHKGPQFVELFNTFWVFQDRAGGIKRVYSLFMLQLQKDVASKPCKVTFGWLSDTVSVVGKNADILSVSCLLIDR